MKSTRRAFASKRHRILHCQLRDCFPTSKEVIVRRKSSYYPQKIDRLRFLHKAALMQRNDESVPFQGNNLGLDRRILESNPQVNRNRPQNVGSDGKIRRNCCKLCLMLLVSPVVDLLCAAKPSPTRFVAVSSFCLKVSVQTGHS